MLFSVREKENKVSTDVTSLAQWDDDNSSHDKLVWWSRLDNRYQIEVHYTDEYGKGILYIFDHQDGDKKIHQEDVGLAYGALFGPDAYDVDEWRNRAEGVVDNLQKPT